MSYYKQIMDVHKTILKGYKMGAKYFSLSFCIFSLLSNSEKISGSYFIWSILLSILESGRLNQYSPHQISLKTLTDYFSGPLFKEKRTLTTCSNYKASLILNYE